MITGARAQGFNRLGKDAGALIENFKVQYDAINTLGDLLTALIDELDGPNCLGLTRGGNHFISETAQRQVEYDGSRVRFKGDSVKDMVQPRIETTLLEISLENLRRVIPSSDVTTTGEKTVIRERTRIDMADYMESLSWVRETSDGGIIIVTLYNPLITSNVDITGVDKSEGEMAATFMGFNDDFQDMDYAPYEIVEYKVP